MTATSMGGLDKATLEANGWTVAFESTDGSTEAWTHSDEKGLQYPGIMAPVRGKWGEACVVRGGLKDELSYADLLAALNAEFALDDVDNEISFRSDGDIATPSARQDNSKSVFEIIIRESGERK